MNDEDSLRGKNLLVVSTGSDKKENLLKQLHLLGLNIVLLDQKMTPWAKQYVNKFIKADLTDIASAVKTITDYQSKSSRHLDGVVTFWDDSTRLTSAIANKLKLPGFTFGTVERIKHKGKFRELCRKYGIPAPKFRTIRNKTDLNYVKKNFNFPLILKPAFGSAGILVTKVTTAGKLEQTYNYILQEKTQRKLADEFAKNTDVVAEEYIPGGEIDIDVLVQDGNIRYLTVCDNLATNEPYFVNTGCIYPSLLSRKQLDNVTKLTEKTVAAFKLENGCLHYEAKVDGNKVCPIELNLRLAGDQTEKIIQDCYAINIVEYIAKIAVGIPIPDLRRIDPIHYVVGRYILPGKTGLITKISVPENIEELDFVQDFFLHSKVGDKVGVPPDGYDCLGWLNVVCDTYPVCVTKLNSLLKRINLSIK